MGRGSVFFIKKEADKEDHAPPSIVTGIVHTTVSIFIYICFQRRALSGLVTRWERGAQLGDQEPSDRGESEGEVEDKSVLPSLYTRGVQRDATVVVDAGGLEEDRSETGKSKD